MLARRRSTSYDTVLFILEPTAVARSAAGSKVVVCDYPDGRLEIVREGIALPYTTFDKLQAVNRSEIVEHKRLDEVLTWIADKQDEREVHRSQRAPRRTGQNNHLFGIPDGGLSNGYVKRGRKPGKRTDFVNDPAVIARRKQALAKLKAAE